VLDGFKSGQCGIEHLRAERVTADLYVIARGIDKILFCLRAQFGGLQRQLPRARCLSSVATSDVKVRPVPEFKPSSIKSRRRLFVLVTTDQFPKVFAGVAVLARLDALVNVGAQGIGQGEAHGVLAHGSNHCVFINSCQGGAMERMSFNSPPRGRSPPSTWNSCRPNGIGAIPWT